jgi:hypothetical protein
VPSCALRDYHPLNRHYDTTQPSCKITINTPADFIWQVVREFDMAGTFQTRVVVDLHADGIPASEVLVTFR